MGTILERTRKNGSKAYLAQIAIRKNGATVLRENRTFDRRAAAVAWIAKREKEVRDPEKLARIQSGSPTLAHAIDRYVNDSVRKIGRTKAQVLRSIKGFDIAIKSCPDITSADIFEFAQELAETRQPQTVANYLSHLAAVFSVARPAWGYQLNDQAMKDAFKVTKRMGLTSKARERDRRPTFEELDRLLAHFEDRSVRRPDAAPMHRIIVFALFSTRRLEEITGLQWADLDVDHGRVLVRDMNNPGQKIGNNIWCDLPQPSLDVIQSMPNSSEFIFPYSPGAIGAAFTRACKLLGIDDLHFHDLRHEGISRLFEMGCSIPHAAAVSGHRSWASLKRYTHLRQRGDKYEGWPWLDRVAVLSAV